MHTSLPPNISLISFQPPTNLLIARNRQRRVRVRIIIRAQSRVVVIIGLRRAIEPVHKQPHLACLAREHRLGIVPTHDIINRVADGVDIAGDGEGLDEGEEAVVA